MRRARRWASLALAVVPATAQAATELSMTNRLKDRREVAAGTRAYSIGFQDGRFYANGWHITGEMGGIWAPPLKLADGVWFGIDDEWVGPATQFTSGRGYTRYTLPPAKGLMTAPHGLRPRRPPRRALRARARQPGPRPRRSRSRSTSTPSCSAPTRGPAARATRPRPTICRTRAAYRDGALVFTDKGTLPGGGRTTTRRSSRRPARRSRARSAPASAARSRARCARTATRSRPSACDDGPHGKGAGGQLRYRVTVAARRPRDRLDRRRRLRPRPRRPKELAAALKDPDAQLAAKVAARDRARRAARASTCPATASCRRRSSGASRTSPTSPRPRRTCSSASSTRARRTPRRSTTLERATFIGAGYPDYPWLFATDGEYTAFAAVALGQFEAIKAHLIALRDVSDALNASSGKVAHEIVTDGSVYFGANADPGNTDESAKFPSAVALVWRWTGDDRFRDDLYDFSRRALRYVTDKLDADKDGWPEGLGNVEREGMGEEKLDNAVYLIRGLYDFADMARAKRDRATRAVGHGLADKLRARFDATWWDAESIQYADSLEARTTRVQQQHWIGVTPMEAELTIGGAPTPGLAGRARGRRAGRARERLLQRHRRRSTSASSTPAARAARRARASATIFSLTPRSRPSPRATTAASAPTSSAATRTPTPRRCSSPTSSPARCRRSSRRRTSATPTPTTATSTAAGPAARCSCRPGATTARRGR